MSAPRVLGYARLLGGVVMTIARTEHFRNPGDVIPLISQHEHEAEVARLKGRLRQAAVALGAAADRGLSVSEMVGAGRLADEIERELGDG